MLDRSCSSSWLSPHTFLRVIVLSMLYLYLKASIHLVQHIHCSSPLIVMSQSRKVSTCWVIISLCVVLDISVLLWGEINPRETRLQRSTGLWNFIISMLLCPLFHLAAGHACYSVAALPQTFPMWVGYTTRLCCAALHIKGKRYLLIQHRVTWSYPRLKLRERYSSNNARCHPVVHNPHCVRPAPGHPAEWHLNTAVLLTQRRD